MGLTIHYKLATTLRKTNDIRSLVETVRQFALDLPFKEVGDVQEFVGEEADFHSTEDESEKWLKIQAGGHVKVNDYHYSVTPRHVIAFSTWPGDGCEAANFGFCQYPQSIIHSPSYGLKKRIATK